MNKRWMVTALSGLLLAAPALAKQRIDWQTIERLPTGAHIYVAIFDHIGIWGGVECALQGVTDEKLSCTLDYPGSQYRGRYDQADQVISRTEIRHLCDGKSDRCSVRDHYLCVGERDACGAWDASGGVPFLILAAEAGGGWHPGYQPNSFAGAKLGIAGLTMDLQYDRLNAQNGFSVEGSGVIPVFRVPRWRPKNDRLFFRLYAEPGLGYRAGDGPFGQYASAKALVLIGDKWLNDGVSPYIEIQRRFPFNSPLDGDNRVAFGFMVAVCEHCGLD